MSAELSTTRSALEARIAELRARVEARAAPPAAPLLLRQHHGWAAGELLLCGARLPAASMVVSRHLPSMSLQLQIGRTLSQMVVLRHLHSRSQMVLDLPSRSQMVLLKHLPR